MDEIDSRLARCFSAVFPGLDQLGIREANMSSIAAWDSIATVTLINLVEEEFGVAIDVEDMEHLVSFDQFSKYLKGGRL